MKAVAFSGCRGWLHAGTGASAVVLCSADGFEDFCARQSWAILAEHLAQAGHTTLRFDYRGTGDSDGISGCCDSVASRMSDIHAAIDFLRSLTGATEIALVGLRLGALLAGQVAQHRRDISHAVFLAPPRSGSSYCRELFLKASLTALLPQQASSRFPGEPGGIEVCGFATSRQFLDELSPLSLDGLHCLPARDVLILDIGNRPKDDMAIAVRYENLGARVVRHPFRDYTAMMVEPTSSIPCVAAIDTIVRWLTANVVPRPAHALASATGPNCIESRTWIEAPLEFSAGARIVGILCAPNKPEMTRLTMLMLGSGRDSHIGWGRSSVYLARRLATIGIASLRFDLTGTGATLGTRHHKRAALYQLTALSEVRAAIDALQARGHDRIGIYGACSGAYLAFHAAIADPRVDTLILRDIRRFVWRFEDAIDLMISDRFGSVPADTPQHSATSSTLVDRALRVLKIGKRRLHDTFGALGKVRTDARYARERMKAFTARGGRMQLIFSSDQDSRSNLIRTLGPEFDRFAEESGANIRFIDDADHNFTASTSQQALHEAIEQFLRDQDDARQRRGASQFPLPGASTIALIGEKLADTTGL